MPKMPKMETIAFTCADSMPILSSIWEGETIYLPEESAATTFWAVAVTIDFESTYNYRTGPAGKLVLESVSMSQMVGGSPMVETNTVMTYAERGEILVLTDVVTNATMMGVADPIRSPLAFRDIVANGEPVTRAAAAPAAGEGR